jgi:hypothetical protein
MVGLLFLALAATASAECAWVLWTYDGASRFGIKTWSVKAPVETYEQCPDSINRHRAQALITTFRCELERARPVLLRAARSAPGPNA